VPAALLVGAAALLGRPLAVLLSTWRFDLSWREQAFLSWSGLRGAVPIVLAIVPVATGVPGSRDILAVVFVLVVLYTLIQAPTLPLVGRRLGVVEDLQARDLEVEAAPLEAVGADLLQVTVRPGSHLHGVYVDELRLPAGAVLSLVVRAGSGSVPTANTRLEVGDQLLVVATTASRSQAEDRLRAVSRDGKLARWYAPAASAQPARRRADRVRRPPG
jgi:cell volume regulation protein A